MNSTPFVILSAEIANLGAVVNAERSAQLFDRLTAMGMEPVTCEGFYKSIPETSYLVRLARGDSDPSYEALLDLAFFWDQEAVLYVDAQRRAYLDNPETREIVELGTWYELDPWDPAPESYTVDPDGRRFAVAECPVGSYDSGAD